MRSNISKEFWIGALIGFLVPLFSVILISVVFSITRDESPLYFLQQAGNVKGLQANLVKLSLVFNLIPFFLFMRKGKLRNGYGVIFTTLIFAFILIFNYLV